MSAASRILSGIVTRIVRMDQAYRERRRVMEMEDRLFADLGLSREKFLEYHCSLGRQKFGATGHEQPAASRRTA